MSDVSGREYERARALKYFLSTSFMRSHAAGEGLSVVYGTDLALVCFLAQPKQNQPLTTSGAKKIRYPPCGNNITLRFGSPISNFVNRITGWSSVLAHRTSSVSGGKVFDSHEDLREILRDPCRSVELDLMSDLGSGSDLIHPICLIHYLSIHHA